MVIFLSCVKTKASRRCKASQMYTSELFQLSLRYAKSLRPRKIYILSAKYGLLELDDTIEPYNLTLKTMDAHQRKAWAYKVIKQMEHRGIDFSEKAIFLCGKPYREYVMRRFTDAEAPLKNVRMGYQMQFYRNHLKSDK